MVETYSIDEAFLDMTGIAKPLHHARELRKLVKQWTGIPVSVGIGPTKTLSKVANRMAKKRPGSAGVCALTTPEEILAAFAEIPVEEVWASAAKQAKFWLKTAFIALSSSGSNLTDGSERICMW